jgi:hypothetical protein
MRKGARWDPAGEEPYAVFPPKIAAKRRYDKVKRNLREDIKTGIPGTPYWGQTAGHVPGIHPICARSCMVTLKFCTLRPLTPRSEDLSGGKAFNTIQPPASFVEFILCCTPS